MNRFVADPVGYRVGFLLRHDNGDFYVPSDNCETDLLLLNGDRWAGDEIDSTIGGVFLVIAFDVFPEPTMIANVAKLIESVMERHSESH